MCLIYLKKNTEYTDASRKEQSRLGSGLTLLQMAADSDVLLSTTYILIFGYQG